MSNMDTVDNISVLHGLVTQTFLNSGTSIHCYFVEFTKAFDNVVRDSL